MYLDNIFLYYTFPNKYLITGKYTVSVGSNFTLFLVIEEPKKNGVSNQREIALRAHMLSNLNIIIFINALVYKAVVFNCVINLIVQTLRFNVNPFMTSSSWTIRFWQHYQFERKNFINAFLYLAMKFFCFDAFHCVQ